MSKVFAILGNEKNIGNDVKIVIMVIIIITI